MNAIGPHAAVAAPAILRPHAALAAEMIGPQRWLGLFNTHTGETVSVAYHDGRRLVAQVDGGNGHSGKRSPELHFGLGDVPRGVPLPVDLAWRDAAGKLHRQTVRLAPGRHTLLLGEPQGRES